MSSTASNKQHGVFIVDDHPLVRQALVQLIRHERSLNVCGEAGDIDTSLKAIGETRPDIVIVDLSLGGGSGVRLIEELKLRRPDIAILVLSMLDEVIYAERCLRAGARGYVMKSEPPQQVIGALLKIVAGDIAVSDRIASALLSGLSSGRTQQNSSMGNLSNRELEVLQLLGQGLSPQQIAEKVHRSVKTVHTHMERMKKKLRLRDHRSLLLYAGRSLNGEKFRDLSE
ncbi:MAG: response regulator transcription factor [Nitrospirae bacterium]|nr:response regulator transcription factor [Nitrospirota bacterium]